MCTSFHPYFYSMEKSSEMFVRISNKYGSFCLRVALACLLVAVTWIWKNNDSGQVLFYA